jgi:predicted DsbA family dithiol-disulfide isomerase
MPTLLKVDFLSDVVCPWCVVGLGGLEEALHRVKGQVEVDIRFHPFELNPNMPPEGQNRTEHITQKYGISPEQARINREGLRQRAAAVGFDMRMTDESRVYNSFDAHRLLQWAEDKGRQMALKKALFLAYFNEGLDIGDTEVLVPKAEAAGLDPAEAREILVSGRYTGEVRHAERLWRQRGINSVPAVVVENKYLISGGQPAGAFEEALRRIASEKRLNPEAMP